MQKADLFAASQSLKELPAEDPRTQRLHMDFKERFAEKLKVKLEELYKTKQWSDAKEYIYVLKRIPIHLRPSPETYLDDLGEAQIWVDEQKDKWYYSKFKDNRTIPGADVYLNETLGCMDQYVRKYRKYLEEKDNYYKYELTFNQIKWHEKAEDEDDFQIVIHSSFINNNKAFKIGTR